MFSRNGYSLFVMMTDSLSVVFGHFFEKYLFKRLFQKLGFLFFFRCELMQTICVFEQNLSYCYLLSHQFAKK